MFYLHPPFPKHTHAALKAVAVPDGPAEPPAEHDVLPAEAAEPDHETSFAAKDSSLNFVIFLSPISIAKTARM